MKLLLFSQTFCAPCRQLKPVLTVAAHFAGVEIEEIMLDDPSRTEKENWALAQKYGVTYTPTVFAVGPHGWQRLESTDPKRELEPDEGLFVAETIQQEIELYGSDV